MQNKGLYQKQFLQRNPCEIHYHEEYAIYENFLDLIDKSL